MPDSFQRISKRDAPRKRETTTNCLWPKSTTMDLLRPFYICSRKASGVPFCKIDPCNMVTLSQILNGSMFQRTRTLGRIVPRKISPVSFYHSPRVLVHPWKPKKTPPSEYISGEIQRKTKHSGCKIYGCRTMWPGLDRSYESTFISFGKNNNKQSNHPVLGSMFGEEMP